MIKLSIKKVVALLFLALLMTSLLFIQTVAAQPGVAYIEPPVIYTNVCQEFTVTVIANVEVPIHMFEFLLYFDPSQMDFINVMVIPPWVLTGLTVGSNYIWVQAYDGLVGPGLVPLAGVTFHCKAAGTSQLTFDFVYVMDDAGDMWSLPWKGATVTQYDLYWKPGDLIDYAPSGVPDFDQKQDAWTNPRTGQWSYCGPTAIANSFWWLDSFYEPNPVAPPSINDNFPLVWSYSHLWDDHDPQNVGPLIQDLAWYMDTDGQRTGSTHNGTKVTDMARGIDQYLLDHGLYNKFYQKTVKAPDFYYIEEEVEKCEDVTLLLGFWQTDGVRWWRVGGHYVTVAGVDSDGLLIAFSDPCVDNAEAGGPGIVLPAAHGYPHGSSVHNDTRFVSHDIYAAWVPGHGGSPGNPMFEVGYNEYEVVDWATLISNTMGQNSPDEFASQSGPYNAGLTVYAEVEYAVIVSCKTGLVAAGSEDTNVYVWDFFGNLQWTWATGPPVISVALDNEANYLVSGSRFLPDGPGVLSFFDAKAVTGGGLNPPLWAMQLPISESYDGGWMGTESKSVDVKYNFYNQFDVVAAATDLGLYLFDQWGNQIWYYTDEWPETIVRISQDGNYIVCADYHSMILHYFSHLSDGVPGWGPNDGIPLWSFGGYVHEFAVYWTAISGIGDYVAVSGWVEPYPPSQPQNTAMVILLNSTGGWIWYYPLPKGGFVRVDMPCHGRSVVSVNDDPSESKGCDLNYWSDMADGTLGWSSADGTPVWNYWPDKELGSGQTPTHDFYTVAISENGEYVATGGIPKNTYLLKKDGTLQQKVGLMPGAIQSVDLTFSGKYGASVDNAGAIWFFSADAGFLWSWGNPLEAPFHCVAVSKIYPCMFPYPNHDLTITKITTCKDGCSPKPIVCKGYTCHINVTIVNDGDFSESFTVTIYANSTLIGTRNVVNLVAHDLAVVTFVWNTSDFSYANYTISACASIVPDEIDVYDNTNVDGCLLVTIPGDVDGDFRVTMGDIIAICDAFGSKIGQPTYNPNADINDDHKISMDDIIIACDHFGQHYP